MQLNATAKRVTKMTEKAQAALETSGKKRKNDASSTSGASGPTSSKAKKARSNQISGNSTDRTTEPLSPSLTPTQSHQTIDRTEEEEAARYEDATNISDQSDGDGDGDGEGDGEGEALAEESAEDELSEIYKFKIKPVLII